MPGEVKRVLDDDNLLVVAYYFMLVFKNPQRQWLAGAEQELAQLLQQRAIIDNRIVELTKTIQALTPIVQNSEHTINMSVPQLCLESMAVIHTALGRLVTSGYVESKSVLGSQQFRITVTGRAALQAW